MANLDIELNIYSAKDLENVNRISKMDVYAVVSINGDDSQKNLKEKTPADCTGGSEPNWNHVVKLSVNQRLAHEGRLTLVVKLLSSRLFGGKDLGEVQVPLLELIHGPSSPSPSFNGNGSGSGKGQGMMTFVTYQVKTPSGKGQGSLTFSYRFDTPICNPDVPVYQNPIDTSPGFQSTTSYHPPTEAGLYPPLSSIEYPPSAPPYPYLNEYDSPNPEQPFTVFPPPYPSASNLDPPPYYSTSMPLHQSYPPRSGHSYHQAEPSQVFHEYALTSSQNQHANAYPPPPPSPECGDGSPTKQQPPKKENKSRLGLVGTGAVLVGGALGGLLIGDMVSDIDLDFDY